MTNCASRICGTLFFALLAGCAALPEPSDAESYNGRGSYYAQRGQFDRAIADFNKALLLDANNADAYSNRGLATAQGKEDYKSAIGDYTRALELKPRHTSAYFNRGVAYRQLGDYPKAIADYSKALELSPRLPDGYYNRAVAYFLDKQYDKAWADLHKAESLGRAIGADFREALRKASGREQ
jgi:tetratricopeptide (TPR) repeat protein